jgi:hypothetical protein
MVALDFNGSTAGRVIYLRRAPPTGFIAWRHDLELARSALGARCLTPHVTESEWLGHFTAGRSPRESLELELLACSD